MTEQPAPGFGPLLRRLRIDAGLTQEELARRAQISDRTISDLERGISSTARASTARLLAGAMGLSGSQRRMFEAAARGQPAAEPAGANDAELHSGFNRMPARTLPRDVAAFTGRAAELEWLARKAAEPGSAGVVQIFAIGGMAGIGKTALSVHAAHRLAERFPDGQFFVPLHGHTPGHRPADPGDTLAGLLQTIAGLPGSQIPAGLDDRAACWRAYLAGKKTLLVLDDAARHEQIGPLIPGSEGSLVLITSRRRLTALDDAAVIELDALPAADAADLLVRLAGRPNLDRGDPLVGQIIRLCGYLPLAIGMLASQLRHRPSWTTASLAAELTQASNRLDLMRAENLSVAAAFDLSYRRLTGRQQRLFRRLGLQLGPQVDAYAAAALDGTSLTLARHGLDALYERHLLIEPSPGRYMLHDLLRAHAQALAAADEPAACEAATTRLMDYYVHTAIAASHRLPGATASGPEPPGHPPAFSPALATPGEAAAWLAAERSNLQAATVSGRRVPEYLVTSVLAGAEVAWAGEYWKQVLAQYEETLAIAVHDGDQAGQARALRLVAHARVRNHDLAGAISAVEQAAPLYLSLGDRVGHANALVWVGALRGVNGDATAMAVLRRAVSLFSELGYQHGHVDALAYLAAAHLVTADYPAATASARQALELARSAGDRSGQESALFYLMQVQRLTGDLESALDTVQQALKLNRDTGDRVMHAFVLDELAAVQRLSGEDRAAAATITAACQEWAGTGRLEGQAAALNVLGQIQAQTGDPHVAAQTYRQALQLLAEFGGEPYDRGEVIINLGEADAVTGAFTQAREHFDQALVLGRRHGFPLVEARALEGLGRCQIQAGDRAEGTAQLHQALGIYQRIGAPNAVGLQQFLHARAAEPGSRVRPTPVET